MSLGRGPNPRISWRAEGHRGEINAEATFLSRHYVPSRTWPIRPNHPDIPPSPPIRGYELVSVMADKLSAVSRRVAPRDFYDLNNLLLAGVDIRAGWELYVAHHQNPEIQYGWRPHPSDIRASYLGRRARLFSRWNDLVQEGRLPAYPVDEALANVDAAISAALDRWKRELSPGELHRLKQEHLRQRRGGSVTGRILKEPPAPRPGPRPPGNESRCLPHLLDQVRGRLPCRLGFPVQTECVKTFSGCSGMARLLFRRLKVRSTPTLPGT